MSEFQSAVATMGTAQSAMAAKPRISADAFRNLTARLKKPDTVIPDLTPTVAVSVPTPEPVIVQSAASRPAADDVSLVQILNSVEAAPKAFDPVVIEPVSLEPVAFDMPQPLPVAIGATVVVPEPVIAIQAETMIQPIEIEPVAELQPIIEVTSLIEPVVETPATETYAFPLLQEPATLQPIEIASVEPVVVIEKSNFDQNFTYVPEPGKQHEKDDLGAIDEAVKKGVAERAVEIELENIWRMLLAKPTADDRLVYLREAKEIHADDEEWNKPEPEFDLSRIEPAEAPGEVESTGVFPSELVPVVERSLVDNLPVAEGQDLSELARSLLDMMAAGNSSGLPQERALAADTLLRLVPRLELKPLLMVAQRLAMMDNPPQLLVSRLIRDPRVEVAGPLLEDCPHIGDKDLEQVVLEGEPPKMRMIARRRKLSRAISDALIKSGEPSVVLTLVRNMEAEISHDGFQSLMVLCETNEELLAPLATRQDLTAPFAFEMFWLAPVQLRRFILSRFLTDSETLTKILKITMATNNDDESEAEPLSQHALLEALERAARGQIEIAAEELSGIMQLSTATIAKILSDLQGDALVVMLKAAAYPRSSMMGLLKRMQSADLPLISRERDLAELQSMFETLSFNKARILLTYWDWAQSKTGPYAAAH